MNDVKVVYDASAEANHLGRLVYGLWAVHGRQFNDRVTARLREWIDAVHSRERRADGDVEQAAHRLAVALDKAADNGELLEGELWNAHLLLALESWRMARARSCRKCGCTDEDCSGCIERTGLPCRWVEEDLCSACAEAEALEVADALGGLVELGILSLIAGSDGEIRFSLTEKGRAEASLLESAPARVDSAPVASAAGTPPPAVEAPSEVANGWRERDVLECPCCGETGALADQDGLFWDGQPLWCGCEGEVHCDIETDPWISAADCPCEGNGVAPVGPGAAELTGLGFKSWECVWDQARRTYAPHPRDPEAVRHFTRRIEGEVA